jgi:hypothetical protein
MKKIFAALMVAMVLSLNLAGFAATVATANDTSAASFNILAAVTAKKHTLKKLTLSSSAAEEWIVKCGATPLLYFEIPASTVVVQEFVDNEVQCPTNTAVVLAKTTAGTKASVIVRYEDQ